MGKTNIRINIDPADRILLGRKLGKDGAAQKFFTHEVRRMCEPYVPHLTGIMEQTAIEKATSIEYVQPYSRKQYYENGGLNRSKAPHAGREWDKRMWPDRGKEIVQSVARFTGGKAR